MQQRVPNLDMQHICKHYAFCHPIETKGEQAPQ
jgi:hypothetical protein